MRFPKRGGQWRYGINLGRLHQLLAEYPDADYLFPGPDDSLVIGSTADVPRGWWVPLAAVDLRTETVEPVAAELIAAIRAKSVGDAEIVLHRTRPSGETD